MPLALFLGTGEATLTVLDGGALARDTAFAEFDSSMALAPGTDLTLVPGNHVYVPAAVPGTFSAESSVSCIIVGLDFAAIGSDG